MPTEVFLERLAKGKPIFDVNELQAAVDEDRRILHEWKPDIAIGDFRVSLSISARRMSIPYLAITDSYWSPYAVRRFPLSDVPLRWVGNRLAEALFEYISPLAFSIHTRPINAIRRQNGLPSVGNDLCLAYTDADYVAYADIPELIEKPGLPLHHDHIGPVLFEPEVSLPGWWNDVPPRPSIYVALGTSGRIDILPKIVSALSSLPVNLLIATADHDVAIPTPTASVANVLRAPFLPGGITAERSSLVICNGGSGTTQQALRAGVPVLGIASNMDQLMNMEPIEKMGAGLTIGSWCASVANIRDASRRLLEEVSFQTSAVRLQAMIRRFDPHQKFPEMIARLLGAHERRDHLRPSMSIRTMS
jgi:UDP:flavonoid glycosyltransferase YjiC (YdhE family)